MRNRTLCAFVVCYIFARTAFSFDGAQAPLSTMPLSDLFKGSGSMVILKGETITGLNLDGTPTTQQDVIYYGPNESLTSNVDFYQQNAGKLGCIAMVQTTDNNHNGGFAVTLTEGQSIAWDTDETAKFEIMSKGDDRGIPIQGFRISFYAAHSKLSVMECTVEGPGALKPMTIQDFEDATGGRMTLRPT
jgi:hypothetical protein